MEQKRSDVEQQLDKLYEDSREAIKQNLDTIDGLLTSTLATSNELQHQNRLLDSNLKTADQLLQQTDERDRETKPVQKLQKLVNAARTTKPKSEQKVKLTDLLSKQRGTVEVTLDKLTELLQIVNQRGLRSCEQAEEDLKLLNVSSFYCC